MSSCASVMGLSTLPEGFITVFSALEGLLESEVYVDNAASPFSALLKAPDTNYLAGDAFNRQFISDVSTALNFWDPLTPDNDDWSQVAADCHPNPYIRPYKRRRYTLNRTDWKSPSFPMAEGFVLEAVDLPLLRSKEYHNANSLYDWASNYKNDDAFMANGVGFYVRTADTITNWSLSDGHYKDKIAIGVISKEEYRRKGLSIAAVAAVVQECFNRGFSSIDWLCVDFNQGSRAIAEKLGFCHVATYDAFTSYPPCENILDLSEADWLEWGAYFENVSPIEPRLLGEQLLAFAKGNAVEKAIRTILAIEEHKKDHDSSDFRWISKLPDYIAYFQTIGLSSDFSGREWKGFLEKHTLFPA